MKKLFTFFVAYILWSMQTALAAISVSGTIAANTTWTAANSPYTVTGSITVQTGVTLTIETGVTIKFSDNQYLYVYGTLNADSVTFTSSNASPAAGKWAYFQIGSSTLAGTANISNSLVQYAQKFHVENGTATLTNTNISNCSLDGIVVTNKGILNMTGGNISAVSQSGVAVNSGGVATLNGVGITNATQNGITLSSNSTINLTGCTVSLCNYPVYYNDYASVTLSGINSFTGNTKKNIYFNFSSLSSDMTIPTYSIPLLFPSGFTVNAGKTLEIKSNNIVKFPDGSALNVNGTLIADANTGAGEYIYFTSTKDDSWGGDSNGDGTTTSPAINNWYGIRFNDTSIDAACKLNGCKIRYSGYGSSGGLYVINSSPVFTNCEVTNSYSGVEINTGGSPSITNITITSCTYPFYYSGEGNITLSGTNSYTGNTNNYAILNFSQVNNFLGLPTLVNLPYYFPSGMNVNASGHMVIGSNNILKFSNYTDLEIYGTLMASAPEGENIYFTSITDDNWGGDTNKDGTTTAPSSEKWYGVRFQNSSDDANCLMRRCKVRYAGYNNTGGISMFDASPTIDFCDISNCYYGAFMQYASNPVFTNNTIGSSEMTPIAMSYEADPILNNNTLSFSDNTYDAIGLIGGTLTANATLKIRSVTSVPNITYLMLDQIIIPAGKSLTINKGIVIKSYTQYNKRIIVEGTLTANATADSMITFTSSKDDNYGNPGDSNKDGTITSPVVSDCGGIIFNPGSSGTLNYCRIKYAQVYYYGFTTCSTTEYVNESAVAMIDASPTISNCEFKDLTYGISCYRASNPIISNNIMTNIKYTPFCISGSSNATFTGNTFTNVGWRAIGLLGGNVCQNGTIKKCNVAGFTNISYVLLSNMTIKSGTFINVEPGVVIKVNNCNIYVDGGFKTDGTTTSSVILTSLQDDNEGNPLDSNGDGNATTPAAGNWGSIKFNSTSDDTYCLLNYTNIKYAGNTSVGGVTYENAGGQLKNSTVSNISNYGVYCNGNSTPTLDNVTIQNCSLDPIAMSLTSNPTFANISFVSNNSQAIKIIEGTLSSDATLISRNVAGITNIAYIIDKLEISTNAKLTIQPDVVIKFRADSWPWSGSANIVVYGNLIAKGSATNKIYFTSFADDSKGGDSNNNGNATSPAKGDWGQSINVCDQFNCWKNGGIVFLNNSINAETVNNLAYCEISYAGTGLYINNSHVTIDNCVIQLANYYGASVLGSANPEFKSCQFYNITRSPIELSMFSNPSFTSCTALNVGLMALSVYPETYSQSATVPLRNFGGYTNISYYMEDQCTINSGTTITIPAGVVFKSDYANGFVVNGGLNIQGVAGNPVIFTNGKDDSCGNPLDTNQDGTASVPNTGSQGWSENWITFNDVSDDLSSIDNVVMKYGNIGIAALSASPVINHTRFENLYYGVDMNGVSAPKIDNCTFHNLHYFPMQISLVSYPASTLNNVISGTTYKVIKVKDETLTQDVTLPKRDFGGVTNIPYYFEHYTIGTGATLTISPGIVCKFRVRAGYWDDNGIDIYKGLSAIGGPEPENNIVFTTIYDDFYGGDSNSDGTATSANGDYFWNGWNGLIFEDQSLDPLCKLKNCIIRYAETGINTISASPTIENCTLNNNSYGVYATAASNPVFSNCDFNDNYYFAIDNVDKSFVINATNCWWGSNLGPNQTNTAGNGTSIQEIVSTFVNITPWKTSGTENPLMGDASLNGTIQAYDAALILQHVVGSLTLNTTQQRVADVSGATGITAFDASLILQYVVGLIQGFPAELKTADLSARTYAQLTVGSANAENGEEVTIPLSVTNVSGMLSTDIKLQYDPAYLQIKQVTQIVSGMNMRCSIDSINGILTIAMAGTYALKSDTVLAQVTFRTSLPSRTTTFNALTVNKFFANESDRRSGVTNGSVTIIGNTAGIPTNIDNAREGIVMVYPNPSPGYTMLTYQLKGNNQRVIIDVINLTGQKVVTLVDETMNSGKYMVPVSNNGSPLNSGVYFIRMTVDSFSQTQKFLIVR